MAELAANHLMAARLAAIVEASDDAIVGKTLEGAILSWNPAAERMYGYSATEMVGQSIYLLVPPTLRSEEQQILERVSRGETVAHYETVRLREDGTEIDISLTISPIRDASGVIVGAGSIQRDITGLKRAEEALRQTAKMEAIGRLAGGLAHDFNNQLHALGGFAHLIERDPSLSAAGRQDLLEIQKAIDRMASLTRQLLAFARQQVLNPETLDLNVAVADAQPLLQRLIGSNMEISLVLAPGPKWVRVDRAQFVQVLMNLVINSRDAMPRGGRIMLRTETLEVSPRQLLDREQTPVEPGAYAELTVTDTGEGVPPEQLSRIFEPFYTTKEVGRGTGLGLATVDGIVSQSGGRIQAVSTVDLGTTISILLPLTTEPAARPLKGSSGGTSRTPRERLLVIDDEELVRTVIARTLQAEGYEVLVARQGKEAIEILEQVGGAVDLVLTDVIMPVMGGRQLVEELAGRYPALPVIWMSGHPVEIGTIDIETTANRPFLQKPIPPEILLETVAQVLERRSLRR